MIKKGKRRMEDKKREIDELVQKLDRMLKEGDSTKETKEVLERLEKLLKEYLKEE